MRWRVEKSDSVVPAAPSPRPFDFAQGRAEGACDAALLRKMKRLVFCWGDLSWLPLMSQGRGHEWGAQGDEWATRRYEFVPLQASKANIAAQIL
jgi:hypothetical protein